MITPEMIHWLANLIWFSLALTAIIVLFNIVKFLYLILKKEPERFIPKNAGRIIVSFVDTTEQ